MTSLPIVEYRDFYDVPRLVLIEVDQRLVLLDNPFDDGLDDYSPDYDVYELERDPRYPATRDWRSLSSEGRHLGTVPVGSITFDPTRRQSLRSAALTSLLG
ncbi:MAG: hypothetical protein H0U52_05285 [Chloroflexi bacterium]|nr:hypothetical protein [Chloroflexota bacterium]